MSLRPKLLRDFGPEIQQRIAASYCKHVVVLDECWSWNGTVDKGYARLSVRLGAGRKVNLAAHRVSYELFVKPLGREELVLHMCDNPECTSPLHLRAGSSSDNVNDALAKGRHYLPYPRIPKERQDAIRFHGKAMMADGASLYRTTQKLAERFGVGATTIRRILTEQYRSR